MSTHTDTTHVATGQTSAPLAQVATAASVVVLTIAGWLVLALILLGAVSYPHVPFTS